MPRSSLSRRLNIVWITIMWTKATVICLFLSAIVSVPETVVGQQQMLGTDHLQLIEIRGKQRRDRIDGLTGVARTAPAPALEPLNPPRSTARQPAYDLHPNSGTLTPSGESIEFLGMEELQALIQSSIDASRVSEAQAKWNSIEQKLDSNLQDIRQLSQRIESVSQTPSQNVSSGTVASSISHLAPGIPRPEAQITPTSSPLQSSAVPWLTLTLSAFLVSLFALTLSAYRLGLSRASHLDRPTAPPQHVPTTVAEQYMPESSELRPRRTRGLAWPHEDAKAEATVLPLPVSQQEEIPEPLAPNIDLSTDDSATILSFETFSDQHRDEKKQKQEVNSALMAQILQDNLNLSNKAS